MAYTLSEAAINITVTGAEKVRSTIGGIVGLLNPLGSSLKALAIGGGLAASIGFAAKKAMDLEEAIDDMRDVLKETGQDVESGMARFNNLERTLWSISNTTKATTRELMQTGLEMGLTADQAERLTTVSVLWSKRAGVEPQEGLRMLQSLLVGKTKALDKMFPAIARVSSIEEKWKVVMGMAGQGVGMLSGDLDTAKGAFDHMLGSINNLYTKMGTALLPVIKYVAQELDKAVQWLEALINTANEFISLRWGTEIKTMSDWVEKLKEGFNQFFTTVGEKLAIITYAIINWNNSWDIVKKGFDVLLNHMWDAFQWLGKMVGILFDQLFKKASESFVKEIKRGILDSEIMLPPGVRDKWTAQVNGTYKDKERNKEAFDYVQKMVRDGKAPDEALNYERTGLSRAMWDGGDVLSVNREKLSPEVRAEFEAIEKRNRQKFQDEKSGALVGDLPKLTQSKSTQAAEAAFRKSYAGQEAGINDFLGKLKAAGPMDKDSAIKSLWDTLKRSLNLSKEVGKGEKEKKEDKVSWTALGEDWKKMQAGISGDDPQKQTAKNTAEMATSLKTVADWITTKYKEGTDAIARYGK